MTEEEKQELEALRSEKRQRVQTERAAAALQTAGIPADFAALLWGSDDADTDSRTQQFCGIYQSALSEDIRSRLPAKAPENAPTNAKPRQQRGIRILK